MKDLIELLKEGVIYAPTHHLQVVNEEHTNALMKQAAEALEELQAKIDDLKSDEIYGWVYEDKYISPKFILNCRNQESGKNPSDAFLDENKEFLTPLFKHSKPSPPLITYEDGFVDGIKWAEEKVRSKYEN